MSDIIAYVRGGLGDIYPMLARLPRIVKDLKKDIYKTKVFVDSLYFNQSNSLNCQSMISLLNASQFSNIYRVPADTHSTFESLPTEHPYRVWGIPIEKILHDFMFWREETTKNYLRSHMNKDTILIDSPISARIYKWENDCNSDMAFTLGESIQPSITLSEKTIIDNMITSNTILIHIRKRGPKVAPNSYKTIDYCLDRNLKVILCGLAATGSEYIHGNVIDLRYKILSLGAMFYLISKIPFMITTTGGFACHRLYLSNTNHRTLIQAPCSCGHYKISFHPIYLKQSCNTFLNDEDVDYMEDVKKWVDNI